MTEIYVDSWEDYQLIGREILIDEGLIKEKDEKGIPVVNYIYPLRRKPSNEAIIKIHKATDCTVVEKGGEYFLALCAGGTDSSQDIALAYLIAESRIPFDEAVTTSTQPKLTLNGKHYRKAMRGLIKSLRADIAYARRQIKKAREGIRESLEIDKREK